MSELATIHAAPATGALTLAPVPSLAGILPPDPGRTRSRLETGSTVSPANDVLADVETALAIGGVGNEGASPKFLAKTDNTLTSVPPAPVLLQADDPTSSPAAQPAAVTTLPADRNATAFAIGWADAVAPAQSSGRLGVVGLDTAASARDASVNFARANSTNTADAGFSPGGNLLASDRLTNASVTVETVQEVPSLAAPTTTSSIPAPAIAAATTNAAAYAWGLGGYGNLGNGTTDNSTTPVPVSNLNTGVTAVAAGSIHGLAIQNGAAYAWGNNGNGELGNGTKTTSSVPVAVSTLSSGVTAVAGGQYFSLAVQNGAAYAWGAGGYGELGNGSVNDSTTPVAVSTLSSGVTAVAAGGYHSIAIQNGGVYAWGLGAEGQLGNGATNDSATPVAVLNLGTGVTAVAAGNADGLAVKNGALYTWGDNGNGQLGDGTTTQRNSPVAILSLSTGVTAVAAGGYHSLAVMNGNVYAWGNNGSGQLGTGNLTNSLTPVEIDPTDLKNITAVAAGQYSSYALASDGSLWVWGDNTYGQLGLGNTTTGYKSPQHLVPPNGEMYIAIDADANGQTVEAILVPEPATWLGGALLFVTAGLTLRRRSREA